MACQGVTDPCAYRLLPEQTIVRAGSFDHSPVTRQSCGGCRRPGQNGTSQCFEKLLRQCLFMQADKPPDIGMIGSDASDHPHASQINMCQPFQRPQ